MNGRKQRKGKQNTQTTTNVHIKIVKVKDSCNSPGVVETVPGGLGSRISMIFDT
jgi:hypothetical protein